LLQYYSTLAPPLKLGLIPSLVRDTLPVSALEIRVHTPEHPWRENSF